MRKIFMFLTAALGFTALLVSCDKAEEKLTLTPDKTAIAADGVEAVAFTVKLGDLDVTSGAKIMNSGTGTEIQGASFTATEAGNYRFHAEYDGKKSDEVTVTVSTPQYGELVLTVDKQSIAGDDEDTATFTVTYGGEDVTSESSVCMTSGSCLMSNEFSTDEPGNYEFYASYTGTPGMKSNYVTVTVTVPEDLDLVLTADKALVPAATGQKITFTVMHGNTDVTSSARIVNQRTGNDITGNTFTTADNRKDSFIAVYNGGSSARVDIQKEVPGDFFKRIAVWRFTGVWCSNCYPASISMDKIVKETYPDRIVHIAVHGNGGGSSTDPMTTTDGNSLLGSIGVKGFPTLMYDYRVNSLGWNSEEWDLESCEKALDFPANCGLAVETSLEGNTLTVDVTVWAGSPDEYYLNVALLEDGIVEDQLTPEGTYVKDYVHDNVVRKLGYTKYGGASVGELERHGQQTVRYTFDMSGFDTSKCKIAAHAFIGTGQGNTRVGTNAALCPVGGSVDFKFK